MCISLDFEKYWGVHDTISPYPIESFNKVSEIVDRLLVLFKKYDIHCTWATVGLLNFKTYEELANYTKNIVIPYQNHDYSPFPITKHQLKELDNTIFTAQPEIDKIIKSEGQELASHTFSHFYCLEKGQNSDDFQIDLGAFKTIVSPDATSIVFPRNQVNTDYLDHCFKAGFTAYRGNQNSKFWRNSAFEKETFFQKTGRTLDAYIKLEKNPPITWDSLKTNPKQPVNIPACRFLRPSRFIKPIENLKVKRIKKEMLQAARTGSIYHLWWHPHNFINHTDQNFNQLESILSYFKDLRKDYDFESLNMNEIYHKID